MVNDIRPSVSRSVEASFPSAEVSTHHIMRCYKRYTISCRISRLYRCAAMLRGSVFAISGVSDVEPIYVATNHPPRRPMNQERRECDRVRRGTSRTAIGGSKAKRPQCNLSCRSGRVNLRKLVLEKRLWRSYPPKNKFANNRDPQHHFVGCKDAINYRKVTQ